MALPLRRYEQIAAILVKYGFEVAVADLLPNTVQWRLRRQKSETVNINVNRRVRLAIQEMGPTFVKFGQIMSTRRELLSPELIEELKLLTDKVDPSPFEKVQPTIEEYCGNIDETFVYLNKRPFVAASLSQVHHGKLRDGTVVVLKVQRPGIKEQIETDLRILKAIADRAERTSTDLQIFNFPSMIVDFARQIMSELDFTRDGKNAELIAKNMKDFERVRIPKIYWQYTGSRLLVMEYMKGVRIDRVDLIEKLGVDPKDIAQLGFKAYMKQIFEDGFFHANPHPGNLLVNPQGELVFLDFGLIGVLRPEKRDILLKMLVAIVDKDVDDLIEVFDSLGIGIRDQWMDAFKDDLYLAVMESDTHARGGSADSFEGVVSAMRKYRLKVPMVTMLMIKVILMVEDDGNKLNPEFNFMEEVKPVIASIFRKRVMNQANIAKAGFDLIEAFQSAKDLPDNVNSFFKRLSKGTVTFKIAHDDLDRLGNSVDRASYKILLGLVMASIVIGMSLVILATQSVFSPQTFQVSIVVYAIAVVLGLVSVIQLIRERDKR
jgi:ubiquinone biosynthesis protein